MRRVFALQRELSICQVRRGMPLTSDDSIKWSGGRDSARLLIDLNDSLLTVLEAALLTWRGVLSIAATFSTALSLPVTAPCTRSFATLIHRHYLN